MCRPALFNHGESFPFLFIEADVERTLWPFRPTHAVLEFGSEAAAHPRGRTADEFARHVARLLDHLRSEGVEPLIELAQPLADGHPA